MRIYLNLALVLSVLINPITAHASQASQKLGVCLVDSLNGKERKELAKWVYFAMSAHSTIKPYANIKQPDVGRLNKYVGELVTRLLTSDCPDVASEAFDEGGSLAFEYAFGVVGKVAMQELMAEPSVAESMGAFEKYLDQEKLKKVFK